MNNGVLLANPVSRRRVAVVGSSGGSAVLFGTPHELLEALEGELALVSNGACVVAAQLVCCEAPLDGAHARSPASLWIVDASVSAEPQCLLRSDLRAVNERARELDAALAKTVPTLDGVVAVSADARLGGANCGALLAAGASGVPVAGSGGSSLAVAAADHGCRLAGNAGGSVATSARTKAIGVAASLAGCWGEAYAPASFLGKEAPPWRSVAAELLPAFVCAAVLAKFRVLPDSARLLAPAAGAFVATKYARDLGAVACLGGALLGALCGGSPAAAALGAVAYAVLAPHMLALASRFRAPGTLATFLVAGALPAGLGVAFWVAVAPVADACAAAARAAVARALGQPLLNAAAAVALQHGARRGWYHAYFLPAILLEHEALAMSAVGALDVLALCCVGAGACAAQLAVPRGPSPRQAPPPKGNPEGSPAPPAPPPPRAGADGDLALRGLLVNLCCGDYVEACHPFLARDRALDVAAYAASGLAGLAGAGARSSAYLPLPLSLFVADEPGAFAAAALVALAGPFVVGCASNAKHNARAAAAAAAAKKAAPPPDKRAPANDGPAYRTRRQSWQ